MTLMYLAYISVSIDLLAGHEEEQTFAFQNHIAAFHF
jgi:hypothetical protein